uniref:SitA5 family polymorphic toxin n=1 Tax=Archangium lipolyticum TaxID=2970465 RepID=UPI00214A0D5A|nr:hypothetical protein [Archangium lipolyticum]
MDFAPVQVGEAEFTAAVSALLLDMPLRVVSSARVQPGGRLAPGSGGSGGDAWQSDLARSYGRFCERRGTQGDCLTLFDDGPQLQADDKLKMALALAVGPALEGVAAELRATFDPNQVLATVTLGITAYMALWLAPDPVVTKSVALASTVLMWGYLGSELFEVTRAYVRLSEEAARATTFAELRDAGERFGRVIGPNSVRILVMLTTAALGETAELMGRASKLPGFRQVSRTVETRQALRLVDAATGSERLIISSVEGTLRAVVPMTALAMAAPGGGSGSFSSGGSRTPKQGILLPNGHRAFKSFDDFKDFMGPAGDGNQWHHIVEQRKVNVDRFGPEAIHNTENVIAVEKARHDAISAYYSSKSRDTGNMVVREWLRTKSYEEQRAFGLDILRQFGVLP